MITGLLGSLSGGFSPLGLSGCVLWLDASQLAGVSDTDAVASWTDLSGQGNHAVQEVALSRPIYKTNIVNGRSVVRFSPDSFLTLPDLSSLTAGTVFAVFRNAQADDGRNVFGLMGASNDPTCYLPSVFDQKYYDSTLTTIRKEAINFSIPSGAVIYCVQSQTDLWENWLNGVLGYSTSTNTVSAPAAGTLGKAGVGSYYNGDIAEFLLYSTILSASNCQSVEDYLSDKYSIIIDLAPVNTVLPALSGTAQIGETLTSDNGTWTNTPTTYAYQWYAKNNGGYDVLAGYTSNSFTALAEHSGKRVRSGVTPSNAFATGAEAFSLDSDQIV